MYGRITITFTDKNPDIAENATMGFESSAVESIEDFSANFQSIVDMSLSKVFKEAVDRFKKSREAKLIKSQEEPTVKAEEDKGAAKKKKEVPDKPKPPANVVLALSQGG